MSNIIAKMRAHKILSGIAAIVLIIIIYFSYRSFTSGSTTSYVLTTVQKGTLISTVSGSGQVLASSQVDVKPKISGDISNIVVKEGQQINAGALIAQLDSTDAAKAVRDAQLALDSAKISLEKFKIDQGTTQQSRSETLKNDYNDGFNQMAGAYSDLVSIVTGANGVLYDDVLKGSCSPNLCQYDNYFSDADSLRAFNSLSSVAVSDYNTAKNAYDVSLEKFRQMRPLETTPDTLKPMMDDTLLTTRLVAQAVKSEQNMLNYLISYLNQKYNSSSSAVPSQITTYQNNLAAYTATLNSRISGLSGSIDSINSQEEAIASGTLGDPVDLSDQENTVSQKEAALTDAQTNLADCYIRAPFDGVVAKVSVNNGDVVSGSTAIVTMITNQHLASITLNELDATKIVIGQKATLTYDALPDLSIAGQVSEVDAIGTVSQGVASYNIKIAQLTQDDRIKPGMSVTASIITNVASDVLILPSSAVKTQGTQKYVETLPNAVTSATSGTSTSSSTPINVPVTVGATNDTQSEITSGLNEGDSVVSRTISSTTTTSTGTTTGTGAAAGARGGGGGVRVFGL
ncbi:MAG: efflux RND transporter periplasmic adaptor subunit [Minisyncoccia bacterium]